MVGMKFSEWKTLTIRKLLELKSESKNEIIDEAIKKVHSAKVRDLSTVIYFFYTHSKEIPELLNLLPPQDVLEQFFIKGRRK
ncbi:MAG: hypothetical protein QW540_08145 [Archaeoglobaceae archaeon]